MGKKIEVHKFGGENTIPNRIIVIGTRPDGTKEDAFNVPVGEWPKQYVRVDMYYWWDKEGSTRDVRAHVVFKQTDEGWKQVYTRTRKGSQIWDTGE